jgi:membrane-bound lytic murein transglycosylase D
MLRRKIFAVAFVVMSFSCIQPLFALSLFGEADREPVKPSSVQPVAVTNNPPSPAQPVAGDTPVRGPVSGQSLINQLLRLPIPESVYFCDEPVPLNFEDSYERLDYELVSILGSPVATTLWFKRAPRYFPLIEAIIQDMGLPSDLKYVALIESDLRASAVSTAGAVGPWQFMLPTANFCGLNKNGWCDDRMHWERATRAALKHLSDLKNSLGSWALALAAYNAGQGRVAKALEEQGAYDFYSLRLARETERYVFRAIAAKLVMENPSWFGIDLTGARLYRPEAVSSVSVNIPVASVSVAGMAKAVGVSYRRFLELNPWITARELPRGTYEILVPAGREGLLKDFVSGLTARLPAVQEASSSLSLGPSVAVASTSAPAGIKHHVVKKGDTLSSIAREYGVSVEDIREWNKLSPNSSIQPGQRLLLRR